MVEAVATSNTKVLDSDRLPDPCNDRQMPNVRAPPLRPLSLERVFPNNCANANMNVELVKNYLFEGGRISI